MEHRHGQVGLVPFTAAVSPDAAAILTNLSSALGAGNDLSPVIEKLALSILPEWRHLQFERHAYQKQIEDLQGKIAMLEQDLTAATVAALATPTNASRMSDELLTGAPSAAEPDGQLSSLGSYQGKRFLKSIHDLDPSARRKRRAKFVRCLLELSDTYGMDMPYLSNIVTELKEASSSAQGHVRVNTGPASVPVSHPQYPGQAYSGAQASQHPAFIMPAHLSSSASASNASSDVNAGGREGGGVGSVATWDPTVSNGVVGFAPMAPQNADVAMAQLAKGVEMETERPSALDTASLPDASSGDSAVLGRGLGDSGPPSTASSAGSVGSTGRKSLKRAADEAL